MVAEHGDSLILRYTGEKPARTPVNKYSGGEDLTTPTAGSRRMPHPTLESTMSREQLRSPPMSPRASPMSSPSRPKLLNSSIKTGSFEDLFKTEKDRAGASTKNPAFAPQIESPRSKAHSYTDAADWKKMKRGTDRGYTSTEIDLCLRGDESIAKKEDYATTPSFLGSRKGPMDPSVREVYGKPSVRKPYNMYQGDGDVAVSPRHIRTFMHSTSYGLNQLPERMSSAFENKPAKKMTPEVPSDMPRRETVTDILYQKPVFTNQHVLTNTGLHPGEIVVGKGTPGNQPATTMHNSPRRDKNFDNLVNHICKPAGAEARNMAALFRARDQSSMNFTSTFG